MSQCKCGKYGFKDHPLVETEQMCYSCFQELVQTKKLKLVRCPNYRKNFKHDSLLRATKLNEKKNLL